jgi:hypothetical protein
MTADKRLFIGIVMALAGACGGTADEPPSFDAADDAPKVAELIPILDARPARHRTEAQTAEEPEPDRRPELEVVASEDAPMVAPAPTRSRPSSARARRRPIRQAWITGGTSFPRPPLTAAQRARLYKPAPPLPETAAEPQRFAPVLRAGPRWGGNRIGLGRVRAR